VTGGSSGVGFELSRILYRAGGTIYCMSHYEGRGLVAIEAVKSTVQTSTPGGFHFIPLDLANLTTIYPAISAFLAAETRLDILFNNAGRASLPLDYKTAQGLEPHFGINCAGGWLVTQLLTPILTATAKISPANSVRITWTSSVLVDIMAPKGGVVMKEVRTPSKQRHEHYSASKAGNWFLVYEWNRRFGASTDVVSLALNPGSLKTNTWRSTPWYHYWPYYFLLGNPIDEARTNLWTAFSKDITIEDGGRYVIPWGRRHTTMRADITAGLKEEKDGGTGMAVQFRNWCEEATKPFAQD
jgi:NAD(P)-dependent dehydrogenase (short-subunit alcohol dehydrogenase family)